MIEKEIAVKSYWDITLKNEFIVQDKDTLVILLPGAGYTTKAPLLYYSFNASLYLGYDILALEYGFQKSEKEIGPRELAIQHILSETREAIQECLKQKKYKKLIFIGKSLGTDIQSLLADEFREYAQKHLFLTPLRRSFDTIKVTDCMVAIGTKDPNFDKEVMSSLKELDHVSLHIIEGADHSMEISDFHGDIKIMAEISEAIYRYISG